MSLTKAEQLAAIQGDPAAALSFVIDNNPAAIQSNLDSVGLLPPTMPNPTKRDLKNVIESITEEDTPQNRDLFQYVTSVDYVDENTNYTGGFRKELENAAEEKAGGVGVLIFEGVLQLGTQVFGYLSLQEQADIAAAQAAAAEAYKDANTTLGIPNNVFIAIVAVLGLIIIVTLLRATR